MGQDLRDFVRINRIEDVDYLMTMGPERRVSGVFQRMDGRVSMGNERGSGEVA
jgi:hypothetical protein